MRNALAALFWLCIGWAMSAAVSAAVWSVENGAIARMEGNVRVAQSMPGAVQSISARSDGGAWVTTGDGLWSVSPDGRVQLHFDFAAHGLGNALRSAADSYDGSVWVATDAFLLLHLASDGSLQQGATLPAPASAIAADLDASTWLIANGALMHFARNATWLDTRALGLGADERVTALAVDALRDRIWVATSRALYRLATHESSAPVVALRGETAAFAVDPRSGTLLAILDGSLIALDESARHAQALDRVLAPDEQPLAVHHDAADGVFVVETADALLRIASDGRVLERGPASAGATLAATPFRVDPALALLRPPGGGAMTDPRAEIVLHIGANCNGAMCDVPRTYVESVRIDAALDGLPLGDARIDAGGRTTFPLRPSMTPGMNELTATAVDRFGHVTTLDRARWTLLASGDSPAARAAPVDADAGNPIAKAANKPPIVSLTSPVSGASFSTGSGIILSANASDPDGTIAKVEFYRGGTTLIGSATSAPFRYVWANAPAGSYSLTAKAYDNRNGTATSVAATIVVVNNQLPIVTLTSPAAGSFARAGSPVTVAASANDADGTIAAVEFFDGTVSLGVAAATPYQVTWIPLSPGLHTLTAKATDDRDGVRSSSVDIIVGDAPVVVVTSPLDCSAVDGPLNVMLTADAISAAGAIASLQFFDNGSAVGTATAAPWQALLVDASPGSHSITVKATDDRGLTTVSRPSTFTVRAANQPPSVSITAPSDGTRFPFGAAINLMATAADADGRITAVEFRTGSAGGTLIGRAISAPYAATWTNASAGTYAVVAVAYDDRNAATTSATVHLTIDANALPAIAMTAPTANATYTAPANITMAASASDSDGSITKLEFYAGTTLVGTVSALPYSVIWSNVAAGPYSLTAKATDNAGGATISAPVAITVTSNVLPTVALTAPAAGSQYFAPATIALLADASDSDGGIARVDFYANGALAGSATSPPYRLVWDAVMAGTYAITAKATDNTGGTATSLPVTITVVGAPTLDIDGALSGASIDDDNILVRGFVSAPNNSAVTVNGVVTHIDDFGGFQANDVPLTPGVNTVTAIVTTQDGQTTSQTITINSTGPGAFIVHASPTEGLNSLQVTFTVENPGNVAFKQVSFDLDNDGVPNLFATPNQFADGKLTVLATYPVGTWLATVRFYDDQDHVIYTARKSIVVRLPVALQGNLRAIYDGMLSRLRAGNIPGALTAFTGSAYDKYSAIFAQLQPSLTSIVDQLGDVQEVTFNMDLAEFTIARNTPDGPVRFLVYLIRSEDGIWRIDGM